MRKTCFLSCYLLFFVGDTMLCKWFIMVFSFGVVRHVNTTVNLISISLSISLSYIILKLRGVTCTPKQVYCTPLCTHICGVHEACFGVVISFPLNISSQRLSLWERGRVKRQRETRWFWFSPWLNHHIGLVHMLETITLLSCREGLSRDITPFV